ncbi:MAG TPA: hypothetical protein VL949_12550 [Geobacteraceae bacterium]|nr:hypothetical protein [Geobacteraceae bacterium]
MTMKQLRKIMPLMALLALSGCARLPTGPSVLVLPAPNKPFDVFQAEVATCRQWASQQLGASSGDYYESDEAQRRYDNAYIQCMYAKGNQVSGLH